MFLCIAFTPGKRLAEVSCVCGATLLTFYIAFILLLYFKPWDSIWIAVSVCKYNCHRKEGFVCCKACLCTCAVSETHTM